jgi:NTE family protein
VEDCLSVTRALVLGGGGVVGIAWEVGILTGLAEEGFDLTGLPTLHGHQPDAILGTSAGSMVGALLGTHTLAELADLSTRDDRAEVIMETVALLDFTLMAECFGAWQKVGLPTPEALKMVCDFALKTQTISEDRFVDSFADMVSPAWPDSRFRCYAVNTSTGERVEWTHASGVETGRAIASSCSVPSIFPPITITTGATTQRYTDGGVYSGTSIDRVAGTDRILVLAPIGSFAGDTLDSAAAAAVVRETQIVEAAGSSVITLFTDDKTNDATLGTPLTRMDPSMRQPALEHGIRQGHELANQLRGWW